MSVAVPYPGMSAIPGRHPLSWDTCVQDTQEVS